MLHMRHMLLHRELHQAKTVKYKVFLGKTVKNWVPPDKSRCSKKPSVLFPGNSRLPRCTGHLVGKDVIHTCLFRLYMPDQNHQKDSINFHKTLMFINVQKIIFLTHFFLEILQKY